MMTPEEVQAMVRERRAQLARLNPAKIQARAERDRLSARRRQEAEVNELRQIELRNIGVYSFYPTPEHVAELMAEMAGISAGDHVLEPSAGSGNIAGAIAHAGGVPYCIEINAELCRVLEAEGYPTTQGDFLRLQVRPYRFIIMNPPFENFQDGEHILRAFDVLETGGVIVAICTPTLFTRTDRKRSEFRDKIEPHITDRRELPAGTFKASGTGVSSVIIKITK